jgi:hypothetical protein
MFAAEAEVRSAPRGEAYWATILILLPLVFQRLFIGGTTGGYEQYTGLNFAWVGYLVHLLFVFQYLSTRAPDQRFRILTGILLLVLASAAQLYVSASAFRFSFIEIALPFFRALLWLFAIAIYVERYFEPEAFKRAFFDILGIAGALIIFCYIFNLVTGIPFGVNIEKGLPRAHGTFSEPSTLSSVYPGLAVAAIASKRYGLAALSGLVLAVSVSVIALGTAGIAVLLLLAQRSRLGLAIIVYGVITVTVVMTLAASPGAVGKIGDMTSAVTAFLNGTIGQSDLRAYTIDRLLTAINLLAAYLNSGATIDLEESGSLARLLGAMMMLNNMSIDGTTWIGYGLSIYGYIASQLYGSTLDFGFYPYLLSSFGIGIGTILIYLVGAQTLKIRRQDTGMFLISASALVGTIYNSGGGITAYSLPVIALFLPLAKYRERSAGQPRPAVIPSDAPAIA